MTFLTARPIITRSFGFLRFSMWIVAGAAPHLIPACPLTGALLKLFKVAIRAHEGRLGTGPDEERRIIRKQFPGPILIPLRADTDDSGYACQMALRANAVSPGRFQLRRVDHLARFARSGRHRSHMVLPRSVASLATDASLQKWRRIKSILRSCYRLQSAGMTLKTPCSNGSR